MTTSHFRIGNDTTKGGHGRGCARQSAEPPSASPRLVPLCRWPFPQHPRSLQGS